MPNNLEAAQKSFLTFSKRAEKVSREILHDTFVDTEPLTTVLSTRSSQVVYGRRGTGKTHALLYLFEQLRAAGNYPIYIDLRAIGSDASIYNDQNLSTAERSTRLIIDVLNVIAVELYELAVDVLPDHTNPSLLTQRLDDFEAAISEVKVSGPVSIETAGSAGQETKKTAGVGLRIDPTAPAGDVTFGTQRHAETNHSTKRIENGRERFSLHFGRVQGTLSSLMAVLGEPKIWLLIDEWSELPSDLQPYLGDLLRRTILPMQNIVVKIAAIEHRSSFYLAQQGSSYVGLELGADISADLNLDDFLVFDNDQQKSVDFFRNLFFRHVKASEHGTMSYSPIARQIWA